ncbi:MAG TPA: hypothetical protein VLG47_03820 [Candidatus Saccharimonadales bacterium]|nr:hypothetical protein [Candidatus Saccharimonadales bacterium]
MIKKHRKSKKVFQGDIFRLTPVVVAVAVAIFAAHQVIQSRAATLAVASQAEGGTVVGNAATVSDTNASGSSAVKFGSTGGGGGITFNQCTNPTTTIPTNPSDPQDGVTLSGYYITGDTWNFQPYPGSQQTMYICNYNNWYAMVNVNDNTHNGDVKSYPNVHKDFNNPAISTFNTITSTFAHTAPSTGDWDYSYDVWLNDYNIELMIWTQSNGKQAHVPCCSLTASTTIDGINYGIHKSGGYIAYDMPTTMTSGTLNIKHILNDMVSRGYITNSATLAQIDYGVETCNTNSVNTRFDVNNFSVTTN